MKKTYLLLVFALLFNWTMAQEHCAKSYNGYSVEYSADSKGKTLTFKINDYAIEDVTHNGVKYSQILFKHGVTTMKKGFAEVPVVNANLMLGAENDVVVKVVSEDYVDIKLNNPLLPSRGTIYRNEDPQKIPYVIDPASLVNDFYPQSIVETDEPFILREARGVNIYVNPFRYNAVKKTLRIYKSVTLQVADDYSKSTNPLKIQSKSVAPVVNDVYKSLFINYSAEKFANQLAEEGELLVIYTSRDATAIQPYIDWKRQRGFVVHTQVVSTGTNVKSIIQTAYNNNPSLLYVQLVGDWADIKSDLGTTQSAPMDPYMGCVAGSDYYPELIIGRFSASSAAQVTVQVNKAISYEKNPDMSGTWYKNALGIASNEGAGSGDDGEGDTPHMEVIRVNKLSTYTYSNVYTQYQPSATASAVANYVNAGLGVINYCGHGSETTFVTSGYSNTNVNSSTNGSKLPFIFSVACVNGKFHMTTGDCFAEAWLRKENGGAVATIMSTINQPWQPPMRGQDYFNDILIGGYNYTANPGEGTSTTAADKRTTFGSITFNGNVLMLAEQYTNTDTRETFQTWTIFGDASLQVRTDTPKALTVNAAATATSPYSVTVTTGGQPVVNARVALFQNGVTYSALTNSSGVATVTHGFTSGDATLTVSGYNMGTYQATKSVSGGTVTVPSTPTGLATSAITSSSATLTWTAATGASSYDVQVRPQGGSWTTYNTSSNSYNLSGLSSATTYEWQVRATNSAGSSSYSSYISFTTTTVVATYCTSKGNTYSDEWISSVVVGSFSNSSAAAGYTDFTSKTITMTVGTAYSVTLTPGFGGSSYAEGWRIWVDLNNDKDFDDAGELVFAPTATSKTAVTGSITIPAGTATGTTRMRVSMKYNGFPTACETFSYGEVEDYTVSIVAGQVTPPATPTGLATSSITTSSATLSWSASTGATSYSVQVRPQGGSWSTYSTSSTSYSLSGLAAATTYEWQVRANNANGSSSYATAISFTTQSVSLTYCTSKGSNSSYEWIDLVQFAGIDRTSGNDGGYKDMTSMVASVAPGGSYTIYFSAGFKSSSYTEYWAVWIDFNQNGTFDADEKVASGSSSSSATLSATVAIPSTALLGNTRMRVSMKYNAAQTACESFSYGEVEDYTVNISDNRNDYNNNPFAEELGNDAVEVYTIYPNPATDRLVVSLKGIEGEVSLRIYDLQGRLVKETTLNNFDTEINVDDLAKGVYIISVDEEKMPINKRFVKM